MYYLQSRWRLEGKELIYYGLRNRAHLFCNTIKPNRRQREILVRLPADLTEAEKQRLGGLLGEQVVEESERRKVPESYEEARFCKSCCANDFMIPGMEFDDEGRCPLCQTADDVRDLRSLVPLVEEIPRARKSRFDAALFYTGGKDSTYLLYELAKVRGLRVLALTWEIPFLSENAKQSIENAKNASGMWNSSPGQYAGRIWIASTGIFTRGTGIPVPARPLPICCSIRSWSQTGSPAFWSETNQYRCSGCITTIWHRDLPTGSLKPGF